MTMTLKAIRCSTTLFWVLERFNELGLLSFSRTANSKSTKERDRLGESWNLEVGLFGKEFNRIHLILQKEHFSGFCVFMREKRLNRKKFSVLGALCSKASF